MISFKQYIAEEYPFGTSTSVIVFSDVSSSNDLQIPISSTMMNRIFPDTIRTTVFHVLSAENLEGLKKIEGTKKSISAFFKMQASEMESGIASDGGVVAELDADIIISSSTDVLTSVDKTGRRWAPMEFLMGDQWKSRGMKSVFKGLDTLIGTLVKKHLSHLKPKGDMYVYWQNMKTYLKDDGKKLSLIIKDYYDGIEAVLKKNSRVMKKALYDYAKNSKVSDDAWDEQVVNNIKIKKVHILSDEVDLDDLHDMYPKGLVNSGFPDVKFWDDSSTLQTYIAGITRK
jgi:hypothetical protein